MENNYIPTAADAAEAMDKVNGGANTGGLFGLLGGAGLGFLAHNFITAGVSSASLAASGVIGSSNAAALFGGTAAATGLAAAAPGIAAPAAAAAIPALGGLLSFVGSDVVIAGIAISGTVAAIGAAALVGAAVFFLGRAIGKAIGVGKANHLLEERAAQSATRGISRAPEHGLGQSQEQSQSQSTALEQNPSPEQAMSQGASQSAPTEASPESSMSAVARYAAGRGPGQSQGTGQSQNSGQYNVGRTPERATSFLAQELKDAKDRQASMAEGALR